MEVFLHEETMRRHCSPVKSVAVRYMLPVMGPVDGIDLNDVFLNNLQRTWCLCDETKISGNLARLVMGQLVGAPTPFGGVTCEQDSPVCSRVAFAYTKSTDSM